MEFKEEEEEEEGNKLEASQLRLIRTEKKLLVEESEKKEHFDVETFIILAALFREALRKLMGLLNSRNFCCSSSGKKIL